MKIICNSCGKEFSNKEKNINHVCEQKKLNQEDIGIMAEKFVLELEVFPSEYDDYSPCKLKNLKTGKIYMDSEISKIKSMTNISSFKKLIGKKIRITSYTEII